MLFLKYSLNTLYSDGRDAQDASSTSQQTGIALYYLSPAYMQYTAILQCSAVASGLHMGRQSHFHCQCQQKQRQKTDKTNKESFPNNIFVLCS